MNSYISHNKKLKSLIIILLVLFGTISMSLYFYQSANQDDAYYLAYLVDITSHNYTGEEPYTLYLPIPLSSRNQSVFDFGDISSVIGNENISDMHIGETERGPALIVNASGNFTISFVKKVSLQEWKNSSDSSFSMFERNESTTTSTIGRVWMYGNWSHDPEISATIEYYHFSSREGKQMVDEISGTMLRDFSRGWSRYDVHEHPPFVRCTFNVP